MPAANEVFFESSFSYRRQWLAYVWIIVFAPLDVILTWQVLAHLVLMKFEVSHLFGYAFFTLWIGVTGFITIWLIRAILFRPSTQVRIDSAGITIDGQLQPWDNINSIYGNEARNWGRNRITLHYLRKGRMPLAVIRGIPMEPISQEEYAELIDRLDDFLEESFPHVSTD